MNQNISVLVILYDCSWDEISYPKMMGDNKMQSLLWEHSL